MKKNLLFVLLALPFVFISCKNSVEIIVTDDKGNLLIGAHVYITTEDISHIKEYLILSQEYNEQYLLEFKYKLKLDSSEKAEKAVRDSYLKEGREYITKEMDEEYYERCKQQNDNINWVVQSRTNSLGILNCKLKDGMYNIFISKDPIYYGFSENQLTYIGSLYVSGDKTDVFKLRRQYF